MSGNCQALRTAFLTLSRTPYLTLSLLILFRTLVAAGFRPTLETVFPTPYLLILFRTLVVAGYRLLTRKTVFPRVFPTPSLLILFRTLVAAGFRLLTRKTVFPTLCPTPSLLILFRILAETSLGIWFKLNGVYKHYILIECLISIRI